MSSTTRALHELNDYRIEGNLKIIDSINDVLYKINAQIHAAVDASKEAQLLQTIPGVGEYTALVLSSAIDNVERFPDSASLVAYFGLAPSVRNSADVTHSAGQNVSHTLYMYMCLRKPCNSKMNLRHLVNNFCFSRYGINTLNYYFEFHHNIIHIIETF